MPGVQIPHCAAPCDRKARCKALDRLDIATRDLAHRYHAGTDLLAVEQHRAGAAVAGLATDLGALQAQRLAQGLRQPADRVAYDGHGTAVDGGSER